MKHSKKVWLKLRNRYWGVFMSMNLKMRKLVYRNSFETFCNVMLMM